MAILYSKSNKIKANERSFTVISVIAECWQITFPHVRYVLFSENRWQCAKSSANRRVDGWVNPEGLTELDWFTVHAMERSCRLA